MKVNYIQTKKTVVVKVSQKCGEFKHLECTRFSSNRKKAFKMAVNGLVGAM